MITTPTPAGVISLAEAARQAGMSRNGVRYWMKRGVLDAVRIPSRQSRHGFIWGIREPSIEDLRKIVTADRSGRAEASRRERRHMKARVTTNHSTPERRPRVTQELRDLAKRLVRLAERFDGI